MGDLGEDIPESTLDPTGLYLGEPTPVRGVTRPNLRCTDGGGCMGWGPRALRADATTEAFTSNVLRDCQTAVEGEGWGILLRESNLCIQS